MLQQLTNLLCGAIWILATWWLALWTMDLMSSLRW